MRQRIRSRSGRLFELEALAAELGLEQLESRQLLTADLAGVRLILNAGGGTAEVRQWIGEHTESTGGSTTDPTTFQLTVNEQRFVGENDFSGPLPTIWDKFILDPSGELTVGYTGGTPVHVGSSFNTDDGFGMGWLLEGAGSNQRSFSFLHELPESVTIPELNGSWYFTAIALPTSGSAKSSTIEGAYGTVNVKDLVGNYTYTANLIGDTQDGSGTIDSLAAFGLGQIATSEYFAVSKDGNYLTAVDLSYGDGLTYLVIGTRRGSTVTAKEVAGEYRFGAALSGSAAATRGQNLLAFESVYLKLNLDGTLTAYDLADWDNGTQTTVHTGQWNLLPDGHTALITYTDIGEAHLVAFGADKSSFLDFRVNHDTDASYVIGQGQRVEDTDGSGAGQDDHADDGDYDNATTITLNTQGAGTAAGEIETNDDTDLFRVTATTTGTMSVTLSTSGGSLVGMLTVKDHNGNQIDTAAADQGSDTVAITWDITSGSVYYLVVGAVGHASTGVYTLGVSSTGDGGGGGGTDEDYVDDYGADDDGSGDNLLDPGDVPFPTFILPGRAPSGRQAVWEYGSDGSWYYSKLGLRYDTADIIGELATWRDKATDAFMVAGATADGMLLWVRDESTGAYTLRNLTEEAGDGGEIPVAPATYFTLDDGRNAIASLNDKGDVIVFVESQGKTFMVNLSEDEIRAGDKTVPALQGTLTAGISAWGTTIIAGLDADGKVWTVWFSLQGRNGWEASPLSKIAAAAPIAGNLSIYFTSWNGINVAGLGEDGQTRVIWWVPSFKGKWEVSNLTVKFDGPEYKMGTMTTYTTPWNALTIVGITAQGAMVAYWWAPGFDKWEIADFSKVLPKNNPRVIRGPVHAEVRNNGNIWLLGRDTSEQMVRAVWFRSQDKWTSSLLNTDASQF